MNEIINANILNKLSDLKYITELDIDDTTETGLIFKQFIVGIYMNDFEIIKQKSQYIKEKNTIEKSIIIGMAYCNSTLIIDHLINEFEIDINQDYYKENSYMRFLCEHNPNIEVIKYLIDVKKMQNESTSCLMQASKYNKSIDVIRYFIEEKNADIKHCNFERNNSFMLACSMNPNISIIIYLRNHIGSNIFDKNNERMNCFDLSCRTNPNPKIVEYLICEMKIDRKYVTAYLDYETDCINIAIQNNSNLLVAKYLIDNTDLKFNFKWKRKLLYVYHWAKFDSLMEIMYHSENYDRYNHFLNEIIMNCRNDINDEGLLIKINPSEPLVR